MNAFQDFYSAVIDGNGPLAAPGAGDDIAVIGGDTLDPVRVDPGFHGAENVCYSHLWRGLPAACIF